MVTLLSVRQFVSVMLLITSISVFFSSVKSYIVPQRGEGWGLKGPRFFNLRCLCYLSPSNGFGTFRNLYIVLKKPWMTYFTFFGVSRVTRDEDVPRVTLKSPPSKGLLLTTTDNWYMDTLVPVHS